MALSSGASILLFLTFLITYISPSFSETAPTPTEPPTAATKNPTKNPTAPTTKKPTIFPDFCNTHDDNTKNIIQLQKNSKISNYEITDPLVITFNFIIGTNQCTETSTDATIICNLIQFGTGNVLFPQISIKNVKGTLSWIIALNVNGITTDIPDPNIENLVKLNTESSFHIAFRGKQQLIYIGSTKYHFKSDANPFTSIVAKSLPFYTSNPLNDSLNANITKLCVGTKSFNPTKVPSNIPTASPSTATPSSAPQTKPTTVPYRKINCYTEFGENRQKTLKCNNPNYIITSCSVFSDLSDTAIFNNGAYIEREYVNKIITTDGVCYIDYNATKIAKGTKIIPSARCCNFNKAYGDKFRCKYFKSSEIGLIGRNQDSSPTTGATNINEFTFVTCNAQYPLLLGCSTKVEPEKEGIDIITVTKDSNINDIQFYGSFYSQPFSKNKTDYNPEYNLYYKLFDASNTTKIAIPNPMDNKTTTTTTIPSSFKAVSTINLDMTPSSRCISQYGPKKGNYKIISIATCCTENVNITWSEPTEQPTASPTYPLNQKTSYFGLNGTNPGTYFEEYSFEEQITGISKWGIIQVIDKFCAEQADGTTIIGYQGILIGEYQILTRNGTIKSIISNNDYNNEISGNFDIINHCASFELDIDINGTRDYIIGFDIYYTKFAIFGIRFYTAFNREYPCPDNEIFIDTSIDKTDKIGNVETKKEYIMFNSSQKNIVKSYDIGIYKYKFSGFFGYKQTRTLILDLSRSVIASIGFIFVRDTINNIPTSPTTTTTTTKYPTISHGKSSNIEHGKLECYTIWGEKTIKCKNCTIDTMMSCNGYCVSGQIFNTFINDTIMDECIVDTINKKDNIAAIATCCHFHEEPPRNLKRFMYITIIGGSLLLIIIIFIFIYLFFIVRRQKYFNPQDIDDDTKIDKAFQNVGKNTIFDKINKFEIKQRVKEIDLINADSVGLL